MILGQNPPGQKPPDKTPGQKAGGQGFEPCHNTYTLCIVD